MVESLVASARSTIGEEADRTRAGFHSCPDPGSQHITLDGLDRLKEKFSFLKEYSDEFIKATGVDVLIKAETASKKLQRFEKEKKAEDKLYQNRERLETVEVKAGQDNRMDILHEARALPGATCSAAKLWLLARKVMGSSGHPPLSTYDMSAIGLGGCVSAKGWVEIHNPSSPNLSIKMFSIGGCTSRSSKDEDFPDLEDLSELKSAIRVLRGAMVFVHPWNRSIDALESFFNQSSFCAKDMVGLDRQTQLLCQFTDYVLVENACRWRGMEPFLATRDLRNTWEDFLGQKASSFTKKSGGQSSQQKQTHQQNNSSTQRQPAGNTNMPSNRLQVPAYLFKDDICVMWNMGKCLRPAGSCKTMKGLTLRHVCNHRPDQNKPQLVCEKPHMSYPFH